MVAKYTTFPFPEHNTNYHAGSAGTSAHAGNDSAGSADYEAYHCPSYSRAF